MYFPGSRPPLSAISPKYLDTGNLLSVASSSKSTAKIPTYTTRSIAHEGTPAYSLNTEESRADRNQRVASMPTPGESSPKRYDPASLCKILGQKRPLHRYDEDSHELGLAALKRPKTRGTPTRTCNFISLRAVDCASGYNMPRTPDFTDDSMSAQSAGDSFARRLGIHSLAQTSQAQQPYFPPLPISHEPYERLSETYRRDEGFAVDHLTTLHSTSRQASPGLSVSRQTSYDSEFQDNDWSASPRRQYPCSMPGCSVVLSCQSEYKKHMLRHNKTFVCDVPDCRRKLQGFSTINDLDRHKKSVHKIGVKTKSYLCAAEDCHNKSKVWPRLDNFKQHIERMHKSEDPYELIKRSEYDPSKRYSAAQQTGTGLVDPSNLLAGIGSPGDLNDISNATHSPTRSLSGRSNPATFNVQPKGSARDTTTDTTTLDNRPLSGAHGLERVAKFDGIRDRLHPKACVAILVNNTISRDDTIGEMKREAAGFAALGGPAVPSFLRSSLVAH